MSNDYRTCVYLRDKLRALLCYHHFCACSDFVDKSQEHSFPILETRQ